MTATDTDAAAEDPRIERARASVGIALMALQQIEDDLADLADPETLAEILRELFREEDPQAGVFGSLAQLLAVAGKAVDRCRFEQENGIDLDGDVVCQLEEAAAFVIDSAGLRLHYATRTLHPAGERP
ncbi:hypothetical protein [Actinacidiphila paucisporea]|uniref:Uncharacterized protein n=1 Tax=Actinacidiphila paucisporea TaxID=310782 RepID=A0A1M7QSV1_9ACTN|nr:hypothetical protein [Actinacidiphila paucisporea]SHN34495.1 hypothetical protein SAMN05216499_14126 [Actinacidiphila paucisporea]